MHVYREFNVEANVLSKKYLCLDEGKLYVAKFINNAKILDYYVHIF